MPARARTSTIPETMLAAAAEGLGEYVFHLEGGPVRVSSAELAERARRRARQLAALGVEPGDAVGVLGPNRPEWLIAAHGGWLAGAAIVPCQIPLRIADPALFEEQQRRIAEAAGCKLVLADPRLLPFLPDGLGVSWDAELTQSAEEPAAPGAEGTAVIQFTSGSTASPKGVLISHEAVVAQLEMLYAHYYAEGVPQSTVSWVPFFHDLGLIASVVLPAHARSRIELLPTELFARDPVAWLRLVEATRGLGTLGPSSAFGAAIRAAEQRGERIDLSSLIVAHFAAEGVDPTVAQQMADVGVRRFGLQAEALGSTYGLAEAVLGVSYSPMGSGLRFDRVSLEELTRGEVAAPAGGGPERLMASCGAPVMDLRILGEDGGTLGERQIGEVQLRGRSLTSGYIGGAPSPFDGDWLRTGDMGYLADGELFIAGRMRDMVISMGQNYYPEDFEWAAGRLAGVRPGRCAAIARPDSEDVALLVEAIEGIDPVALAREVKRSLRHAIGVAPSEVVVLPRGAVQKTTSGKLRRAAMRDAFARGELPALN